MKRLTSLFFILIACAANLAAQSTKQNSYTFLLTGASFASPNNGWFEIGCSLVGATPINRAIGGEAIADAANRMNAGTLYSREELEKIDEVVECYYTTGDYDLLIKVYVRNNHDLLSLIHEKIQPIGLARTETLICFKEAFRKKLPINFMKEVEK